MVDQTVIMTLTAEAYSRSKLVDIHAESNMKSIPTLEGPAKRFSVGVYDEADSGHSKKKLKIGSTTMNILITMSSRISDNEIFIGPETRIEANNTAVRILYHKTKVKKYLSTVKEQLDSPQKEIYKCPLSVS